MHEFNHVTSALACLALLEKHQAMFLCLFRIPLLPNAGALMVLTLKVISCAMNYSDGLLKEEEGLRDAQKKYRLAKCPSLVEYFGYCLCCGSHFAGPVYEMKDYLEWTERKGVSSLRTLLVGYAMFSPS